jgi:ATP-dependent protease ClpP protease subunit
VSQQGRNGLAAVVLLIGALGIGALLLQVGVNVWQFNESSGWSTELANTLEVFVDQHVDAGYEAPAVHGDDPLLQSRKILLSQDVNARSANDVATRLLFLDSLGNELPIDLYISTQGGWVDNAFTIIDAMRLIEAPVNTWAIGGCYSAGALILASGTGRRVATDNALIMVHANMGDSSEDFSYERLALARYENAFRRSADLPEDWYPTTSAGRYYLTPDEALKFNMVDEVVETWVVDDDQ